MLIAASIIAYLFVGFVFTMSPVGQRVCGDTWAGPPPLLFLVIWPFSVPFSLVVLALAHMNDWLEKQLR